MDRKAYKFSAMSLELIRHPLVLTLYIIGLYNDNSVTFH